MMRNLCSKYAKYFPFAGLLLLLMMPANSSLVFADDQAVIFKNVTVDPNVVPNKQFKVSATVSVSASEGRDVQVSIKVPNEISVIGSVIVDLGRMKQERSDTATWTLIASKTGSFPITMTAYSSDSESGNSESNEFQFDVSIGLKGLAITEMNIPGNVFPNDNIAVVVKLKNTGASVINNIISQLAVPDGLHVIDNVSQNIASIDPEQEIAITWNLRALNPGAYNIMFSYSSSDAGTDSLQGTVNVGIKTVADLRLSKISIGQDGGDVIGPGDRDALVKITLTNSGNHALHDVTATLVLAHPFFLSNQEDESIATNAQSFNTKLINVGESVEASYFISLDEAATPGIYTEKLTVSFLDGKDQINTTYDVPLEVSANIVVSALANKIDMELGSITPIVLDIINNGEKTIHALSVSTAQDDSAYSPVDSPIWVGDLARLETKTVTFNVYTTAETLSFPPLVLMLDYESDGRKLTQTQQIGVQFTGLPDFGIRSVAVDPGLAYSGDTGVKIDLKLVNSGYVAVNGLTAGLRLPESITPAWGGSTTIFLGKLLPEEESTISFFVNIDSNAEPGLSPIVLDLQHDMGLSSLNVDFIIAQKARFELIQVSDSYLYPSASNVPLKVVVKNVGTIAAEEVTTWFVGGNALPGVKSSTVTSVGNTENIGIVVPQQVVNTIFIVNVDPNTVPGAQATTLEIRWSQHGNMFAQTLIVPFNIASGPSYLLYYQGVPFTYVIIAAVLIVGILSFAILRSRKVLSIKHALAQSIQPAIGNQVELESDRDAKKNIGI